MKKNKLQLTCSRHSGMCAEIKRGQVDSEGKLNGHSAAANDGEEELTGSEWL